MNRKVLLVEIGGQGLPAVTPVTRQPSNWVASAKPAVVVPPAEGVETKPAADSVTITWNASPLAGAVYVLWRAADAGGKPGEWKYVTKTSDTRYTYTEASGVVSWWKVTVQVNGVSSADSTPKAQAPVVPPTTAELVQLQGKVDQGLRDLALADAAEAQQRLADFQAAQAQILVESQKSAAAVGEVARRAEDLATNLANEERARIQSVLNEKTERTADISAVNTKVQNGLDSMARSLAEVAAGSGTQFDSAGIWHFNAGLEGWTGVYGAPTIADGMLRPINTTNNSGIQSPAPLNIDGAAYRFIKLRMRKVGNPAWMGLIRWITAADQEWNEAKSLSIPVPAFDANGIAVLDVDRLPWNGPSPLRAIRLALTGAQTASAYIEYDWIAVGRPSPGASVAMVQQESDARTAALAAEAGQRNTLAVQMRGNYTGNDPAQLTGGLAYNEMKARVGADEALSQRQSAVEVRLPAGTGALASEAKVNTVEQASVTRDQAIGQRIDQVNATLPVIAAQGANMVLNGGWQSGRDVAWTYNHASLGVAATEGRAGGACLRVDGGTTVVRGATANGGVPIPVAPGKKYRYGCWYKTTADYNGSANNGKLRLATQDNALIGGATYFSANQGTWTYLGAVYAIPENTSITGLKLNINVDHTAGTLWVDDVAIEEVTEILAVADGLSSLSGTVTQQAGLINAQSGLISALRTDVDGKATNGALQALQSQVTLQGNTITSQGGALTSVQAAINSLGGDNRLRNSSFEVLLPNGVPQYWAPSSSSTDAANKTTRKLVDSVLPGSTKAWRWEMAGIPATAYAECYSSVYRIDPQQPVTVSCNVRGKPGARFFFQLGLKDAAGASVGWPGGPAAGAGMVVTEAWERKTYTFPASQILASATGAALYLRVYGDGSADQWIEVDNAQLQTGAAATGYAPSLEETAAQSNANAEANSALNTRITNAEGQLLSQGTALTAVRAGIGNATVYEITANAIITSQPTGGPRSSGARNAAGAAVGGAGRSLNVQVVNADSTLGQRQTFDTYGNGRSACASFNDWYDNALADNQYFILFTSDHTGSLNSDTGTDTVGTRDRLVDAGATRRNVEALTGTRMFILVGRKRAGEGAGMQRLSPPASTGRADQWVELIVEFVNGRPQGSLDVSALERATQANAAANSSLEARTLANESSVTSLGQSLTSVNARIDAIGGDNLLWNSSMEDAPVATAAPTGWNLERIRSDVGGTFSFIESPLSGGGKAVRIDWNAINAKDWVGLNRAGPGSNYVKVDPNTDYTLSSWVRGTPDARAQLYVQWMNATGGTVLGTVTLPEVTMTGKWQRLLLPARSRGDAVLARVYVGRLFAQQPGPHAIEIDNVQFQRGLVATEYAPSSMESAAAAMANAAATAGLTSTVTQQGQQITALGQSVTGVQAEVKGKASASVVQMLEAKVSNQGSGGNLLINSTFPKYQRNGWGWGENPGAAWVELGDPTPGNDSFHPPGIYGIGSTSGGTTSKQIVWWGTEYGIPVEAGQTYMASAWFNTHRCSCYIEISYWDKTGKWLAQWGSPETGHTGNSGPPLLSEMPRPSIKTVAPPGAALARFRIIVKPNGEAWPYFWMFRPMFSRVEPDATQPPPWNAGGSESSAKWGFALDVNGNVSGMEMEATGAKSELKILSKILRLISPGTPDGMEIQDGYLRVWRGNVQRIIGNGFGPDGLIDYFGPNVGAAGATKRNATVWMDVNGGAYWGGAIAAGIRRNAMQTTTTQTIGASIVVGPFSTSGRNKNVVVSYQRTVVRTNNRMDRQGFVAGGNRNACAVNVYRKLGSNAEQFWTSFEASGGVSITNESDGPDMAISFWSGSVTLNDSEGTQDRTYRAEIVGFSEQDVSHQTGSFTGLDITASLSIVSIEE
ncbi:carbohydrate binding domain-containing protein [Stenotrophomonas sp. NY11291]|uniref:carbohydrate binding domain-containing protein n=1 Tax=Stenotrophomonas sp. NY11291 TaxID=2939415 RepID=UPI00200E9ECB|nr:carbohydrate binding domain-containing protein [Stenotrophomonas sp. NY11291]UQA21813.1 carbohydrate binding domain-containing protein [Stenotrophomonas sp. NY11291]